MIKIFQLLIVSLLSISIYAQSDLACTAPSLTVSIPYYRCSGITATTGTTVGATFSNTSGSYPVPSSCVGGSGGNGGYVYPGTAGGDVWYKFVAPYTSSASNTLTVNVTSGTLTDMAMAIYTATDPCDASTFSQVACSRDKITGSNYMPRVIFDGTNIATGGTTYYIRLWDEGGDLAGTFNILVSSLDIKEDKIINGSNQIVNVYEGGPVYFTDSGVPTGGASGNNYLDCNTQQPYQLNEDGTITFVAPVGKAINVSFQVIPYPSAGSCVTPGDFMISINNRVIGNDYLYIYDGDVNNNPIGTYSGVTPAVPQPGTITSSSNKLSFRFVSDDIGTGNGWTAYVQVVDLPVVHAPVSVTCGSTEVFTDGAGSITSGFDHIYTYCPSTAGSCLNADFTSVNFDYYIDQMKVYDGNSVDAPLIGTFTGSTNTGNTNILQNIRATESNTTGCLTFRYTSGSNARKPYCLIDTLNGSTWNARTGWSADITCATNCRLTNGNNECNSATILSRNGDYATFNINATGTPDISDPLFGSPATANVTGSLCTGGNQITRLEDNLWYKFSVPSSIDCGTAVYNVTFNNISCQHLGAAASGYQFALFETNSCLTGTGWNNSSVLKFCQDKLIGGASVNISSYITLGKTYYIMIDGFTGQHCNADLKFEVSGILNPEDCLLPIFLLDFDGKKVGEDIRLHWTTANEENNKGFHIQRSFNGVDFEDIGWENAANTGSKNNEYYFTDENFNDKKVVYYRLKQEDLDGKNHLHRIVRFDPSMFSKNLIVLANPNPTNGTLYVEMKNLHQEKYTVQIIDLYGKVVFEQIVESQNEQEMLNVDMSKFENGMYMVRVSDGNDNALIKILKN